MDCEAVPCFGAGRSDTCAGIIQTETTLLASRACPTGDPEQASLHQPRGGREGGACATGGLPKAGTTQGGGQVFDRLPADQANFSLKEPLSGPLCQEVCYSIDLGLKARASLPSTATCWCRPSLSSQNPTPPPAGSNMRSKHPEGGYTFLGKKPGLETHAGGQRRPTRGISSDGGTPRRVSCSKPCFKAFIFLCLSGSAATLRLRAGNSSFEGRTGGDGGPNGGRVRFEHRLWTPCLLWLNHDQTQEEKHKKKPTLAGLQLLRQYPRHIKNIFLHTQNLSKKEDA